MYLTFDLGTTALKTALTSADGRLLALHEAGYGEPVIGAPGWLERPIEHYWRAAVAGARAVLAQSPGEVSAIGFASQGQTFVPLDGDGKPLHNALVWLDGRAAEVAARWEREWLDRAAFRRSSGYPWLPPELTLFKLAWLAEHTPAAHRAARFLLLPDYLTWRLTGEAVTDVVTAQSTGLFDLETGDWSPRLLAAAGVGREQLAAVRPSGVTAGTLRAGAAAELGLPAGLPVCTGTNDQLAGALGAGNTGPGIVTETTGTALAAVLTTEQRLDDPEVCVFGHPVPGRHSALAFAPTSAVVLEWLRDLCAGGMGFAELLAEAAAVPVGSDGLVALPNFAGRGRLGDPHGAKGAFVGLTLGHGRAQLARAVLEGCACLLAECLAPLQRHVPARVIRSLGGAARSDLWLQMKADLLGAPVERPAVADAASLGAAMLAATAVGQFAEPAAAASAWYRPAAVFEPGPAAHAAYQKVYERYREMSERVYGGRSYEPLV